MSVNQATILGNVVRDPEIKSLSSGDRLANFSVATSETWKDKASGEKKEKTEFHRITVFNPNLVAVVERYVKKGSKIYLEGSVRTRKWTGQDGAERHTTEIVLTQYGGKIVLLGGPQNAAPARDDYRAPERAAPARTDPRGNPQWAAPRGGDLDDEIPF